MELCDGLRSRRTIRKFLDKKVSRETVLEILTDAHWAPSASNQQPWNFYVVTGEPLTRLCSAIQTAHKEKKKAYDPSKGKTIPARYVARTKKFFKDLRPAINSLGDENRTFIESGSFRFYDAPVVIIVAMHKNMPQSRLMDIGMAAENLMLSAHARGLGSCAIALTLLYADVIHTALGISDDLDTVLCIALGYTDSDFPLNTFRSSRENIEELIMWVGFDV